MKKIYGFLFFFFLCFFSIHVASASTKIAECSYSFKTGGDSNSLSISIDDNGELSYSIPQSSYYRAPNGTDYLVNYKNFNGFSEALYKNGKLASTCPRLAAGIDAMGMVLWIYYGRESSTLEDSNYVDVQTLSGSLKVIDSSISVDTKKEKEYCTLSKSLATNTPITIRFYDDVDGNHMYEVSSYKNKGIQNRALYNGLTTLKIGLTSYTIRMDENWNNISSYWSSEESCKKSKIYLNTPYGDPNQFYITTKEPENSLNNASTFDDKDNGEPYKDIVSEEEKIDRKPLDYDPDLNLKKYCNEAQVARTLKFVGILLYIAKIFVPALIILFGSLDFGKAMLAGKDDEVQKKIPIFIKRFVAGVLIFFIPTILDFLFASLAGYNDTISQYDNCYKCILSPSDCSIP